MRGLGKNIFLVLALTALAAACWWYWPTPPSYIPQNLWGVWRTDNPRYADRYLDISEAIFTIGQGDRRLQVFFVQRVERMATGGRETYTLYYKAPDSTDEAPRTLAFEVGPQKDGRPLRLKNQKGITWYRETPPDQAPAEDRP
jgi:hypothetical protein